MEEERIIDKLVKGEKVKCEFCDAGFWIPFNTTYDKAHCFSCNNCGKSINIDRNDCIVE